MAKTQASHDFDMDVVSTADARKILKKARTRGGRQSKYSPIYDEVEGLGKGKFVVLRGVDKSTKTSLYQGLTRRFDDVKMASSRDRGGDGEVYTVVIGNADDYEQMRAKAQKG